MSISIKIGQVL